MATILTIIFSLCAVYCIFSAFAMHREAIGQLKKEKEKANATILTAAVIAGGVVLTEMLKKAFTKKTIPAPAGEQAPNSNSK